MKLTTFDDRRKLYTIASKVCSDLVPYNQKVFQTRGGALNYRAKLIRDNSTLEGTLVVMECLGWREID